MGDDECLPDAALPTGAECARELVSNLVKSCFLRVLRFIVSRTFRTRRKHERTSCRWSWIRWGRKAVDSVKASEIAEIAET